MQLFRTHIAAENRSYLTGILLVLIATIIWSTVPVGTRMLMHGGGAFSPAFISAGRLWVAALIFLGIRAAQARNSGKQFTPALFRNIWLYIAAGAICANYIMYAIGLRYTTAGATSIVSQVNSVATVLLAAAILGERLTRQKIVGMGLAIVGVLLVLLHGSTARDVISTAHFKGNIIEVVGALAWPFYAIGQTKLMQHGGTRQVLTPIFVIAALLSLLMLPFTGALIVHPPTLRDWAVLLFLGTGSTAAAYWFYAAGLQRIETSIGTMFNVLIPPFALVMACWLLAEPVHINGLLGLALVVTGLVLIAWRRSHSPVRHGVQRVAIHPSK